MTAEEKYLDTKFLVEANSFEHLALWKENNKEYDWQEDTRCEARTMYVNDRPICYTCQWSIINKQRVMFWDPTSQLVDYKLIEEDLKKICPNIISKSNAMNFHNILHDINRLNA